MKTLATALFAATLGMSTASAETILDTTDFDPPGGSIAFGNFLSSDQDPLGQTFILSQAMNNINAGGVFIGLNTANDATFDVTISIIAGAGFGGAELGSADVTLGGDFDGLHTESFAGIGTLEAGTYTLGFTTDGVMRGGLRTQDTPVIGTQTFNENGVFAFEGPSEGATALAVLVTGDAVAAVPVPATLPLMLGGLLLAGGVFRRRRA